jgi:hypothetical protein
MQNDASMAQVESQRKAQQKVSPWKKQTSSTHGSHDGSRAAPVVQGLCAQVEQVPQSPGHVEQSSPDSHAPLPQTGPHDPQSPGQVEHVSPVSQVPLPQTGGHAPQSPGQVEQVSPVSHMPLPHIGGHWPQSIGHEVQVSPVSHTPLPHIGPPPHV